MTVLGSIGKKRRSRIIVVQIISQDDFFAQEKSLAEITAATLAFYDKKRCISHIYEKSCFQ